MKKLNKTRMALPLALVVAAVSYLALSGASFLSAPTSVGANQAPDGSYARKYLGQGDYVWNWDYTDDEESSDHVDWGMRFLFYNNADVDLVKDRLDGEGGDPSIPGMLRSRVGARQYAYMDDHQTQNQFEWDRDSGFKNVNNCRWNLAHMRVYATGDNDRNYNQTYGYYVVATIHKDFEGLGCDFEFESLESDEDWWVDRIRDNLGSDTEYDWTVYDSSLNWGNGVDGVQEIGNGSHSYESDGWGVRVRIPSGG